MICMQSLQCEPGTTNLILGHILNHRRNVPRRCTWALHHVVHIFMAVPRVFCIRNQTCKFRCPGDFDSVGCSLLAEAVGTGVTWPIYEFLHVFHCIVQLCHAGIFCFHRLRAKALSVKHCSSIAAGFQCDGVRGHAVKQFAKRHAERDMFRWKLVRSWDRSHCSLIALSFQKHFWMPGSFGMHWNLRFRDIRIKLPIQPYIAQILSCT